MTYLTLRLSIRGLANTKSYFAYFSDSGYSDCYKLPIFISAIIIKDVLYSSKEKFNIKYIMKNTLNMKIIIMTNCSVT